MHYEIKRRAWEKYLGEKVNDVVVVGAKFSSDSLLLHNANEKIIQNEVK